MNFIRLSVLMFSFVTLFIGIWSYFKIRGKAVNYFKAGATMPVWVVAISLIAPSIDANGSIGAAARSAEYGFWAGACIPIGLAICMFLLGRYFAEPIWKMNIMTLPDFYGRRYNKTTEGLATITMSIGGCILLAGNLAGLAILLGRIFGFDYAVILIIIGVYILTYSLTGGFITSLWTSIFQVAIFVLAIVLAFSWLTFNNGWNELMEVVPQTHKSLAGLLNVERGALVNWAAIISLALGNIVALDLIQRIISSESSQAARRSCYLGGIMTFVVATPVSIIGLYSFYFQEEIGFSLLTNIAIDHMPNWIGALLILGIIAASIAVASGILLAMSNAITRNLFQRFSKSFWDNERLLQTSRLVAIPVMAISLIFAFYRPEPGTLLILAFDIILAGCFVPFVFGMYWKRSNAAAAVAAILSGTLSRLILHLIIPNSLIGIDTLLPPIISCAMFMLVASFTQRISPPKFEVLKTALTDDELITGQF